jgi:hypothetical protein
MEPLTMRAGWRWLRWTSALALMVVLSGCGTNVMYLLKEESRVMAEADPLLLSAEETGSGLEQQVYEAEAAKDEACEFLHAAVFDRFNRDPTFFEQFLSDLSASIVLFIPIGQMEDCAAAFDTYSASVESLASSMQSAAELPRPLAVSRSDNSVN